jgi:hypothetical protein
MPSHLDSWTDWNNAELDLLEQVLLQGRWNSIIIPLGRDNPTRALLSGAGRIVYSWARLPDKSVSVEIRQED